MTVLVTSANGKVGSAVVAALLKKKVAVRVGARTVADARDRFPGAEIVPFDYEDQATMGAALAGADAVLTAAPYWLLPDAEFTLATLAKNAGVRKIVKLSAMGVGEIEGSAHRLAETAIEASGLAWTHLRPTFFMQNYATMMLASIRDQGAFYEAADMAASAFVDTRDIAEVAVAALTEPGHDGRIYTLTGPRALTRREVAETISGVAGKTISYVNVDDAALRAALNGMPPVQIELLSRLYAMVRAGQTATVSDDIRTVLGRAPTDFTDFARDHAAVWRAAA